MPEEKKKVSAAHMRATAKYEKNNYDRILIRLPKGTKDRIRNAGETSVNGFISSLVLNELENREYMKRLKTDPNAMPFE